MHSTHHVFYIQTALDVLFGATKKAMDQNGLASVSYGLLTNTEVNQDIALRNTMQDSLPVATHLVPVPDSAGGESVSINSLRKGRKATLASQRVYNNNLDRDLSRKLFSPGVDDHSSCCGGENPKSSCPPVRKPSPPPPTRRPSPHARRPSPPTTFDPLIGSNITRPMSRLGSVGEEASTSVVTLTSEYERFRSFRLAVVNRMRDQKCLTPEQRKPLRRLHSILSGSVDDEALTISTIAIDAIAESRDWSSEFNRNQTIDVMLSFL